MGFKDFSNNIKFDLLPDHVKKLIKWKQWIVQDMLETKNTTTYFEYINFIDWLNVFLTDNFFIKIENAPKLSGNNIAVWFLIDQTFDKEFLKSMSHEKEYKFINVRGYYKIIEKVDVA